MTMGPLIDIKAMFYLKSPAELALRDDDPIPNYVLSAGVPCFILFILVEWLLGIRHGQKKGNKAPTHRPNDVSMSMSMGIFQFLYQHISSSGFELLGIGSELAFYRVAYGYWRIQTIDPVEYPMLTYITLFLVKDLAYYWMHRFLHTYHIGWAAHIVHHSGEDINMGAGLRQGALQSAIGLPVNIAFQIPLAILGFSPVAYAAHTQLNLLYQFWVHTDLIDRLPLGLEYVLNSPSSHRMHHRPPGNQNYGGVLIVWDRMFGTYRPEIDRKDYYGLAKQVSSFSATEMNITHWRRIASLRGNWLRKLMTKRVKHKWLCDPWLLLKPIPRIEIDRRLEGPVRTKWNGGAPLEDRTRWVINIMGSIIALVVGVMALYLCKTRPSLDLSACLIGMVTVDYASKLWDVPEWTTSLLSILTTATTLFSLLNMDSPLDCTPVILNACHSGNASISLYQSP